MKRQVVVSGFATVDYVARATGVFSGRGVMNMFDDAGALKPRAGGAALYTSLALARSGFQVSPLTWIGDDDDGAHYRAACRRGGLVEAGVAITPGAHTARCLLIYNSDGSYGCLIHRMSASATPQQLDFAASAEVVIITAGSPSVAAALLDRVRPDAKVAWIAKHDPDCFPDDLVARLAERAEVVFCNALERPWLDAIGGVRRGQVIFETHGHLGVYVERQGQRDLCAVEPLEVQDATGAGDTFAGAAMAALMDGAAPLAAAAQGAKAAYALLAGRL